MNTPHLRAGELLSRLPEDGTVVGVEVGVYRAEMSALLLARSDLWLFLVDNWKAQEKQPAHYRATGDPRSRMSAEEQHEALTAAVAATRFAGERAQVRIGDSAAVAPCFPDHSLDFCFIDADHSYQGTAMDIATWAPKVRCGGLLGGHDYGMWEERGFGVRRAVDEACHANGWRLELGQDSTWFVEC